MPQLVFNHFFSSLEIKESIENQLHCWLLDKRQFFIQKSTATMIHTTLSYTLSSEIFGCPTLSALIISCDGTQIMRQSSKQIRVTDWKCLAPVILSSTINNIMPRRSIATPPPPLGDMLLSEGRHWELSVLPQNPTQWTSKFRTLTSPPESRTRAVSYLVKRPLRGYLRSSLLESTLSNSILLREIRNFGFYPWRLCLTYAQQETVLSHPLNWFYKKTAEIKFVSKFFLTSLEDI